MDSLLSGVAIGLAIIGLLVGVLLLLAFDLGVWAVLQRFLDQRSSDRSTALSLRLHEEVQREESGASVPENNEMQRTREPPKRRSL